MFAFPLGVSDVKLTTITITIIINARVILSVCFCNRAASPTSLLQVWPDQPSFPVHPGFIEAHLPVHTVLIPVFDLLVCDYGQGLRKLKVLHQVFQEVLGQLELVFVHPNLLSIGCFLFLFLFLILC